MSPYGNVFSKIKPKPGPSDPGCFCIVLCISGDPVSARLTPPRLQFWFRRTPLQTCPHNAHVHHWACPPFTADEAIKGGQRGSPSSPLSCSLFTNNPKHQRHKLRSVTRLFGRSRDSAPQTNRAAKFLFSPLPRLERKEESFAIFNLPTAKVVVSSFTT